MIGREFKFHNGGNGAALAIRVKASSKRNRIKRVMKDGTVVVHLVGPGKDINERLVQFLAQELQVEQNRLQIIAGLDGTDKLLSILEMQPSEIQRIILDKIA
jgi:uncharacterized protein YggU (UPF0235/DUF167 family)